MISFLFFLVMAALGLIIGFFFWASHGNRLDRDNEQEFFNGPQVGNSDENVGEVVVMSWNMAWGYGMGSEGTNYIPKPKERFVEVLEEMARIIEKKNCDLVLLQEVDFDSAKSGGVDQMKFLAERLGMNWARAITWKTRHLPFPFWPVSSHFGSISSGGAILSRFPIESNRVILHDKPAGNWGFYNAFYLWRFSQIATIRIDQKLWSVCNNHFESWDKQNRIEQAKKVKSALEGSNILALGGDFNTTPAAASKKGRFQGYDEDDYENDETYQVIASIDQLKDALDEAEYLREEKRWFSFSSANPERKLDYIFINKSCQSLEFEVIQTPLSDHFPVVAKIALS